MTSPSGPTGKSPSSKARWVSSGGMTLRAAPMSTSTTVVISAALCGANSSEMRRKRCGIFGASAFSARCADSSADAMRVRALPYLPVCPPGALPCMLMHSPYVAPATQPPVREGVAVRVRSPRDPRPATWRAARPRTGVVRT